MKKLLVLLLLLCSQTVYALHITDSKHFVSIDTDKVVYLTGEIKPGFTVAIVAGQILKTMTESGDRIVVINSRGGDVDTGKEIISMLRQEKAMFRGRIVCVVDGDAMSMAFSLLTFCDVRYATAKSHMIFHDAYVTHLEGQLNPKNLREAADELERQDMPRREKDRAALHMTLPEYRKHADAETNWTASDLLNRQYLNAIVTLDNP
jgi:ATP-dependent protease ClpP protease subunit